MNETKPPTAEEIEHILKALRLMNTALPHKAAAALTYLTQQNQQAREIIGYQQEMLVLLHSDAHPNSPMGQTIAKGRDYLRGQLQEEPQ